MINLLLHPFKSHSFSTSSPSPSTCHSSRPSDHQSHTLSQSSIEESISNAEKIITRWSTRWSPNSSLHDNRAEAVEFLDAVKQLQNSMHYLFLSESPNSPNLIRAHRLMQSAMARLEKEFSRLLISFNLESAESFSLCSSYDEDFSFDDTDTDTGSGDWIQTAASTDLRSISECMISAGYGYECVRIYKAARQSAIDESLRRSGFVRTSPNQLQKLDWEAVEIKIANWLAASKFAVKTLFSGERILCEQVFAGSINESCFAEITRDTACNLFKFPESVAAKCKKSPQKIFWILDLYETLYDLMPEIESIFSYESETAVRQQANATLLKLREQAQNMVSDFESELQKDSSRSPVPGGGLHPLPSYVMDYVCVMANYTGTLAEIFADRPFEVQNPFLESSPAAETPLSSIAARIAWLILVLLCKLDGKAQLYKDTSLSYLFLANNLHHVVSKVKRSELRYLLGEEWVSNHEEKVVQYVANYERAAWGKVVSALPEDRTVEIPLGKAKEALQRFNFAFETAYRTQREWVVLDETVRDDIRVSVVRMVVPAYRAFYKKYQVALKNEGDAGALLRFTPLDLEIRLMKLFSGASRPQASP